MKINKIIAIALAGCALMGATSSCEDMLDVESDGYVFDKNHTLSSANDSLYSAMGILAQMQQVAENYVMLGELRGDLVTVPATAGADYQNISNYLPAGEGSALLSKRAYYNVINNCNVALARMDTTIVEYTNRVMVPEYAAIRTMRNWALLQVGLNFGRAAFPTSPVISVDEVEKEIPVVELNRLVDMLIADLEPMAAVETPDYGTINGQASRQFFIRPMLLLADMLLYRGHYERAAQLYYTYIDRNDLIVDRGNGSYWTSSVRNAANLNNATSYLNEALVRIPFSSDAKDYHPNLVNLTYNTLPTMVPARWFMDEMNTITHYHIDNVGITNISGYLEGDLRGMAVTRTNVEVAGSFGSVKHGMDFNSSLISKYRRNATEFSSVSNVENPLLEGTGAPLTTVVALYRIPHVYLRYAEAVNRAGKPTLAFALLKYGLRKEVVEDPLKVDPDELADEVFWTNFTDLKYDNSYGMAMRGRGLGIAVENTDFVIPADLTREEAIDWVEEQILREMAAETSFEGNRFFDLLRVSAHRPNHPAFFAKEVGRRFDSPAEIEARLSDINALWLK